MKFVAFSVFVSVAAVGCSSSDSGTASPTDPATATVRGQLVTSSFSGTPTGVEAVDDAGAKTRGQLAADGSFTLVLPKDHTYRILVLTASKSEPIVFPRTSGKLDTTFKLSGGGAVVALGAVRHFDAAPAAGFKKAGTVGTSTQLLSSPPEGDETDTPDQTDKPDDQADGECEDGVDANTGAVCVDDDAATSCEAGDGDGETNDDGENVGDDADPSSAMAIPEHNAPDDVAGCQNEEQDGEEEDD